MRQHATLGSPRSEVYGTGDMLAALRCYEHSSRIVFGGKVAPLLLVSPAASTSRTLTRVSTRSITSSSPTPTRSPAFTSGNQYPLGGRRHGCTVGPELKAVGLFVWGCSMATRSPFPSPLSLRPALASKSSSEYDRSRGARCLNADRRNHPPLLFFSDPSTNETADDLPPKCPQIARPNRGQDVTQSPLYQPAWPLSKHAPTASMYIPEALKPAPGSHRPACMPLS